MAASVATLTFPATLSARRVVRGTRVSVDVFAHIGPDRTLVGTLTPETDSPADLALTEWLEAGQIEVAVQTTGGTRRQATIGEAA